MPKMKITDRYMMDDMLWFHDGAHTVFAAAVYQETYEEIVKEGGKYGTYVSRRFVRGPAIQATSIKDPERQAVFVTLVKSANILNKAILAICEGEMLAKSKTRKKKAR